MSSLKPDQFQQAFIDHPLTKNQCVKLEAVAGSGKTTTSVLKIKQLIESGYCEPSEIVFITFSNKSARDLHLKYNKLTGLSVKPEMSTCHSFAIKLLKKYYKIKPVLLNDWSSTLLMRDALEDLGFDKKYKTENKRQLTAIAREFVNLTHWFKSNIAISTPIATTDISEFDFRDFDNHPETDINAKDFTLAFDKYEQYKTNSNTYDYSDLIFKLYTTLLTDQETLLKIRTDYPVFFIDECQDNDQLLFRLIYLLSSTNNLFTIFDTSQTIYSFRWATPWMLEDKYIKKYFNSSVTYPLQYNYRSTANIVNLGNHVRELTNSPIKAIPFHPETKGSVRLITTKNNKSEGQQIVRLINESLAQGYKLSDIAILSRTNSYLKTIVEPALSKDAIPYTLTTKNRKKLFDKPIIQAYFSMMSLILNPDNQLALIELATHVKGIGDTFLSKMKKLNYMGTSIFSVSLSPADSSKVSILTNLQSKLTELSQITNPSSLSLLLVGLEELISLYFKSDFTTRTELDLINKSVSTMVFTYYDDHGIKDLHEIFDKVLLDFTDIDTENKKDSITLMTIHGSKGLEFPVTIAGDQAKSMNQDDDEYSESCILYVQLSRAIDKLVILNSLTYVDYKMQEREAKYSQPFSKLKRKLGV